ncbi:hypothetical protein MTO96_041336 [Rhipicephalus appendiculatus]
MSVHLSKHSFGDVIQEALCWQKNQPRPPKTSFLLLSGCQKERDAYVNDIMADSRSSRNHDKVAVRATSRRDFDDENAASVTEDDTRRRGKRPRSPSRCVPQSPHRKLQLVPTPGLRAFVPRTRHP